MQGQQVRRASPAPTVNPANQLVARRGPGGPYQAAQAGQQLQVAGPSGGVQATGVMGGQQARLNQARAGPYFNPQQVKGFCRMLSLSADQLNRGYADAAKASLSPQAHLDLLQTHDWKHPHLMYKTGLIKNTYTLVFAL